MKKNKLGRTGLNISHVILGGGWVGGLFIDPKFDIMEKALELSLKAGINWVDTAETYSCLLYTSPSPRDRISSRMPSSA